MIKSDAPSRPTIRAALPGKQRCRMHGGASSGPCIAGGIVRMRASKTTHGLRTKEMIELRRLSHSLEAMPCKA
jgi:hypothetical protein